MSLRKQTEEAKADFERRFALAEKEEIEAQTRSFRMVKLSTIFGLTSYDIRVPPVLVFAVLVSFFVAIVYSFIGIYFLASS
jgi:hypothetical protein